MYWYLVKLTYRIICGNGSHTPQFDEQIRVICAPDREQAIDKAMAVGKQEECHFLNNKREKVIWEFINVTEIYKISDQIDGAEVYSRIEERDHADAYISLIHQKAEGLFKNARSQELLGLI